MSETFPKATEVRMAANLLAITFDNGQTRYMRSHFYEGLFGCLVTFTRKRQTFQFAR